MERHQDLFAAAIAALVALAPMQLRAQDAAVGTDFAVDRDNAPVLEKNYSPFVGDDYPNRVLWGETHLHTSYSYDAAFYGVGLLEGVPPIQQEHALKIQVPYRGTDDHAGARLHLADLVHAGQGLR